MTLIMRKPDQSNCENKNLTGISVSEKYVHIHGCQKIWAFLIPKIRSFIYFLFQKGVGYHIPGGAEKGGYSARTSVLCHI